MPRKSSFPDNLTPTEARELTHRAAKYTLGRWVEPGWQAAGTGWGAKPALDARPGGHGTGPRADRHPEGLSAGAGRAASLGGQFNPQRVAGRLRLNLDVPALRPLAAAAIPNPTSRTLIDRKIEVTGTADDPLAVGSIEFHRGFLTLLDRRFSIDQGTITFSGAKPPIPEIDIKASAGASGELQGHRPDHRAGD